MDHIMRLGRWGFARSGGLAEPLVSLQFYVLPQKLDVLNLTADDALSSASDVCEMACRCVQPRHNRTKECKNTPVGRGNLPTKYGTIKDHGPSRGPNRGSHSLIEQSALRIAQSAVSRAPRAAFLCHGLRFYATGCVTCHGLRNS